MTVKIEKKCLDCYRLFKCIELVAWNDRDEIIYCDLKGRTKYDQYKSLTDYHDSLLPNEFELLSSDIYWHLII